MPNSPDEIQKLRDEEKNDKRFTLIKISIPGCESLCGRWWGPKNVRPILCIHGWMDNCGTFDRLIPLLPKEFSYLAFDLPGHGISSRYPPGMIYSYYDCIVLVERIRREYNWDKVSIMGHSLGGVIGYFYSALFPEKIDMLVALDTLEPFIGNACMVMKVNMDQLFKDDERKNGPHQSEPPSYEYDELIQKIVEGSTFSVDHANAKYLLTRSVKKSTKYPKKYYLNYDRRLKGFDRATRHPADLLYFARHISCPLLYLLGRDSYMRGQYFEATIPIRECLEKHNPEFEWKVGPGNHHLHLTHPEAYSEDISQFLRKHKKIISKF